MAVSSLIWIFSARCNLSCRHCYVRPRFLPLPELNFREKLRIIEEASDLGIGYIGFSGGEPLLHEDFPKLVEECYEHGIATSTVTNGLMLDRGIAKKLARLGVRVFLSIDGPDRETHEYLRGPGTWDKAVSSIELLTEAGVDFSTVMAVHRNNYWKTGEYLKFVSSQGLDGAAIIPVMRSGSAQGLAVTAEEYLKAIELAVGTAEDLGLRISLWCTPFANVVTSSPRVSAWSCRLADVADIDPSGRLLLCDVIDLVVTSIPGRGLARALGEFESSPLVRRVSNPGKLHRVCASCPIAHYCRGGCFARALLDKGSLMAPDPLCPRAARGL